MALTSGKRYSEIAAELGVRQHTVENDARAIQRKTSSRTMCQAIYKLAVHVNGNRPSNENP